MTHEEILTTLGHYVDYLIAGSTAEAPLWNIEKVRSGKPNKWNYIDGCMITACLSLYKTTGDEKFLDFSKKFLEDVYKRQRPSATGVRSTASLSLKVRRSPSTRWTMWNTRASAPSAGTASTAHFWHGIPKSKYFALIFPPGAARWDFFVWFASFFCK